MFIVLFFQSLIVSNSTCLFLSIYICLSFSLSFPPKTSLFLFFIILSRVNQLFIPECLLCISASLLTFINCCERTNERMSFFTYFFINLFCFNRIQLNFYGSLKIVMVIWKKLIRLGSTGKVHTFTAADFSPISFIWEVENCFKKRNSEETCFTISTKRNTYCFNFSRVCSFYFRFVPLLLSDGGPEV